jgi:histidyl-tRNA synthetase
MSEKKPNRPKARVAKGFRDIDAEEIRGTRAMLATIQRVYESYGFEPVEQPFVEYTEALGKFLPDQDRPNAGVFSFQDDDEQWLSLRYDLTAPLARFVAENTQGQLPTPYRSYRQGWVFRNEKPGPGRYRQFMQFDADTVGSASPAADAEVCMMAADTMEALGIPRGQYVMKVNNRKLLDGVLAQVNATDVQKLGILRTIDKIDKFPIEEILKLLGKGRKDESGALIDGVGLSADQSSVVLRYINWESEVVVLNPQSRDPHDYSTVNPRSLLASASTNETILSALELSFGSNDIAMDGIKELREIARIVDGAGYADCIKIDKSVVRGLEYYTGPVFECELLMETKDEDGNTVRFGSVGGGGRYDDLVARFTGQQVPATGFSIGVSRLYSALKLTGKAETSKTLAPVVVLVMERERQGDYWKFVQQLRNGGVRAEMYVGTAGMKAQMKYADKRGAPLVIIQGGDEKAKGEVQIKDLRLGSELAANISSREEYASQRLAQVSVPESDLVAQVKKMLG